MNKICLIPLFAGVAFMLSGCLLVPMNYTDSVDLIPNDTSKKYSITYSISYVSEGDTPIGHASREKYIAWINEYLRKSNDFSSVSYKPFDEKSNYHVHFIVHYFIPLEKSVLGGVVSGASLGCIPSWLDMYLDTSAVLYLNGQPVCSPATSEVLRCYVWCPFLPAGVIWNLWWAWSTQERKCCSFLVNGIVQYQRKNL